MNYKILDLTTVTEGELTEAIDANIKTARMVTREVAQLRKVAESAQKTTSGIMDLVTCSPVTEPPKEEIDIDFEDEVDYYYQELKRCPSSELATHISEFLPSRRNYNYIRILYRLKAESLRNIKDIKDFIGGEGLSLEEALEFRDELMLEEERIRLLDEQLSKKPSSETEEDLSETEENNLIFFPNAFGNIRVLDDIDGIDPDYYERFLELFTSIKNGTFKNVKRFSNNSQFAGLCEVKAFKVRVAFTRLGPNSYGIVAAFIKKSDKDLGYKTFLTKQYKDYQSSEPLLKESLSNPDFMALNKEYETELFNKLTKANTAKKPYQKKVGGEEC